MPRIIINGVDYSSATATEKMVADWGFTKNTGDYTKPEDGIPKTDLSEDVQSSLEKADTALQEEEDPTVPQWAKEENPPTYTAEDVGAVSKEAYDDLIIFSDTQPTSEDNKIWIKEETVDVIKILEEEDVLQVVQQGIDDGDIEISTDPQVLSDISGIKNGTIAVGKANAVGTWTQQGITDAISGLTNDIDELETSLVNGDIVVGNADKLDNHDSSYFLNTTQKGTNNGLAELDENGKVPSSQLPSYVDDVVEYDNLESFPTEGESGKIYIATDTNKTYRWSGTQYVVISETLSLGETSSTAYAGDKGKANAEAISALQGTVNALPKSYAPIDAQKNVQSDWNVTDENSDAFIKNKPSIPSQVTEATVSGWGFTKNTGTYIKPSGGIPASDLASGVIPTSLPANGGNSATVNGLTVQTAVPPNAVFTDNDTKNTAGSTDTSSKIFLVGATSQATNSQTYSDNQVYATNGQLDANKFRVAEKVTLEYDSTNQCLNFNFA